MVVGKDDLLYLDLEGNAHNVNEIDERVLKIICEYVINITRADYFIFRLAYDSREILQDWNERCIKVQEGGTVLGKAGEIVGFADWNYSSKRMFRIRINGQFYVFLHTTLEKTVRRYIRRTYTVWIPRLKLVTARMNLSATLNRTVMKSNLQIKTLRSERTERKKAYAPILWQSNSVRSIPKQALIES